MSLPLLGAGPGTDAAAVVLQTYAVWGLPGSVSVAEDSARVVSVATASVTMETS